EVYVGGEILLPDPAVDSAALDALVAEVAAQRSTGSPVVDRRRLASSVVYRQHRSRLPHRSQIAEPATKRREHLDALTVRRMPQRHRLKMVRGDVGRAFAKDLPQPSHGIVAH